MAQTFYPVSPAPNERISYQRLHQSVTRSIPLTGYTAVDDIEAEILKEIGVRAGILSITQPVYTYSGIVAAAQPALWWRLGSGGLTDASGNGRHGAAQGGVTIGGAAGVGGSAATAFDGTDDWISSSYTPFVQGSSRTFEALLYRNDTTTYDAPFGGWPNNYPDCPLLRMDAGTTNFGLFASSGGLGWIGGLTAQWFLLHLLYNDATGMATLYVNGAAPFPGTQGGQPGYTAAGASNTLAVGRWAGGDLFGGRISEFAVYERLLSPAEIASRYTASGL